VSPSCLFRWRKLTLQTELRNAIYEHFIDLNTCACDTNAINLLWVNRQIRAEFRSLYFSQGNAAVYFDDVASFLRAFILPSRTLVLDDVACKIRVELGSGNHDPTNWVFNLVDVISTMRKYPLLNIRWNLVPPGHSQPDNDLGFATQVSLLKDMEDHEFEKVSSVWLHIGAVPYVDGDIHIILKHGCTEQDTDDIHLKIGGRKYKCGGIRLNLDWQPYTEAHTMSRE